MGVSCNPRNANNADPKRNSFKNDTIETWKEMSSGFHLYAAVLSNHTAVSLLYTTSHQLFLFWPEPS